MTSKTTVILVVGWFLLAACSQPKPTPTATPPSSGTPLSIPEITVEPKPSQDLFLRPTIVTRIVTETPVPGRERLEPLCLGVAADSDSLTPWDVGPGNLYAKELADYLKQMGVIEICLPGQLGAPSLEGDWNAAEESPAAKAGRRIEIAFDGIEGLRLVFATYDFVGDGNYVVHATAADHEALLAGEHDNAIVINGQPGFLFIDEPEGLVEKAYVFPLSDHYVALSYRVEKGTNTGDLTAFAEAIRHPPYPQELAQELNVMDGVLATLRLREISAPSVTAQHISD